MIHLECSLADYIPIHTHGSGIEKKLYKIVGWVALSLTGILWGNFLFPPHKSAVVLIRQLNLNKEKDLISKISSEATPTRQSVCDTGIFLSYFSIYF